jgi:hypothetical protein
MNQFASLYRTDAYAETIDGAIAIMKFCAQTDPQAKRVLEIMEKFAKVVAKWTKDHTHEAPELAKDLSGLYSQTASPHLSQEHAALLAGLASARDSEMPRMPPMALQAPLTGQALPPLSELLIPPPAPPGGDIRMNGVSPSHATGPTLPPPMDPRSGISAHAVVDTAEPMNEDIEFDFDGLWSNWINHVVPGSAIQSAMAPPLPPQFPASVPSSDTYAGFSMPPESRISPAAVISGTIPLYHSTNFG